MLGLFTSKAPLVRDIIVPESATAPDAERYALITAVVDYVNHMMEHGAYRRWELPAAAMQAYHCDYYYAQVTNGGHSQFIHNSRMQQGVLHDAEAGLKAMGAKVQLDCLRQMRAWAEANAEAAAAQDGFGTRAAELEALDTRFFEADRAPKTEFYAIATRWMRRQKALTVVPDDRIEIALDKACAANPLAAERADARTVAALTSQVSDPFRVGLYMAALQAEPRHVVQHLVSGQMTNVGGEDHVVWSVRTDQGMRKALHMPGNGVLLLADPAEGEETARRVGAAADQDINLCIGHAQRHDVPMALVAMLRQHGIGAGPDWIAWWGPDEPSSIGKDPALYTVGLAPGQDAHLMIAENGATLVDGSTLEPITKIQRAEIDAFKARISARVEADAKAAEQELGAPKAPPKPAAAPAKPARKPRRRGPEPMFLAQFSDEDLDLVDQDIADLHALLVDPLAVGVSLCLMAQRVPSSLIGIGEPIERWFINDEGCARYEVETSRGMRTASRVSTGVSLHAAGTGGPKETMIHVERDEVVQNAVGAAHRYPAALGLFVLLEQAGLVGRFLTATHYQTGGEGLKQALYSNPRVKGAVEKAIAEMGGLAERRKGVGPSEHFLVTFEDTTLMALAHFGQERAMLLPFSDQANGLFPDIPIIAMQDLLEEEKSLLARLKS